MAIIFCGKIVFFCATPFFFFFFRGVEPALHRKVEQKQRYGFVCFWSKPPSSVPLVASKRKANFACAVRFVCEHEQCLALWNQCKDFWLLALNTTLFGTATKPARPASLAGEFESRLELSRPPLVALCRLKFPGSSREDVEMMARRSSLASVKEREAASAREEGMYRGDVRNQSPHRH